jgi:hypothetical protein
VSGDGVDIAAVYLLLREIGDGVIAHDGQFRAIDRRFEAIDRRFDALERKVDDLGSQVTGLRQTVIEYHASVLGHGILISELGQRLRRVEQHLNLPPAA